MARLGLIDCFDIDNLRLKIGVTDSAAALSFGAVYDAPGIQEMSLEPAMTESESYGSAHVLDFFARIKRVNGSVKQAILSHEQFAVLFGGQMSQDGTSPNEVLTTSFGSVNVPWFEMEFQCLYAGPQASLTGSAHVIIHKARVSKLTYAKKMEGRHEVGFEFVGFPLTYQEPGWNFKRCFSFQEKETAAIAAAAAADTTPPTLSSHVPAAAATGVAVGASIAFTFSEALDPVHCSADNFVLMTSAGVNVPINTPVLSVGNTVVTITPTSAMGASTAHRWTVTRGVRDVAGNRLAANQTNTFTTA